MARCHRIWNKPRAASARKSSRAARALNISTGCVRFLLHSRSSRVCVLTLFIAAVQMEKGQGTFANPVKVPSQEHSRAVGISAFFLQCERACACVLTRCRTRSPKRPRRANVRLFFCRGADAPSRLMAAGSSSPTLACTTCPRWICTLSCTILPSRRRRRAAPSTASTDLESVNLNCYTHTSFVSLLAILFL